MPATPVLSEKKTKLRTASEVLSRLKWSPCNECIPNVDDCLIGYDCRINGPMEKALADFTSIQNGGDIPEHRIQYFRIKSTPNVENSVFWDRDGRVDKLFDSGAGKYAPISKKTIANVKAAIENMIRIAEEKAILAEEKAKRKARQQARKAAAVYRMSDASCNNVGPNGKTLTRLERHTWKAIDHFHYYDSKKSGWCKGNQSMLIDIPNICEDIKILTWNVLFDLEKNEKNEFVQGDSSLLSDIDRTSLRWDQIILEIQSESPCVIALQEVTQRFLDQLQGHEWVQHNYELSSGLGDMSSIDPFGNLIMWRKDRFRLRGLHVCEDMNRCRALVACLQQNETVIYNIANVHLPSDHHNQSTRETDDRTKARQLEISAVVAKIEDLQQKQKKYISTPIVLGDFNTDIDLLPPKYFHDSWALSKSRSDKDGFTYNWKINKRAAKIRSSGFSKKEPRRIDRIYVGATDYVDFEETKLVGNSEGYEFHPSDHFGVCSSIRTKQKHHSMMQHNESGNRHMANVWSGISYPSSDFLLALLLDGKQKFYDEKSTLPLSHITLLNGFVDISSIERQNLACQAIESAFEQVSSHNEMNLCNVSFDYNSFQVFEHQNSATLVCCPDMEEESHFWLKQLYDALRVVFVKCDEQECRFLNGWTPHVSLGSYANSFEARRALYTSFNDATWQMTSVPIGIGLFQRDIMSGEFHLATSIPFTKPLNMYRSLLNDAGEMMTRSMHCISLLVLQEVERACTFATKTIYGKRYALEPSLHVYGSQAIGLSLPMISDIDAILALKCDSTSMTSKEIENYLETIVSRLSYLHKESKIRRRVSSLQGRKIQLLTMKLSSQYPSLDLMVSCIDENGNPLSKVDEDSLNALKDTAFIKSSFSLFQRWNPKCEQIICGAIRILKAWAYQRQIYGTKAGFLGGGGWTILVLWMLSTSKESEISELFDCASVTSCSTKIATYVFRNILSKWSNDCVVTLNNILVNGKGHEFNDDVDRKSNLNVIAPISHGNFGRSSTQSTTYTLKWELQRAKNLLGDKDKFDASIFEKYQQSGPLILLLEIEIPAEKFEGNPKPADVKAWGTSKQLNLVVALERILPAEVIRPSSCVIRKENSFLFPLSILTCDVQNMRIHIDAFVDDKKAEVEEEGRLFLIHGKVLLSCLTKEGFEGKMISKKMLKSDM